MSASSIGGRPSDEVRNNVKVVYAEEKEVGSGRGEEREREGEMREDGRDIDRKEERERNGCGVPEPVVCVAFSSRARILGECVTIYS